MLYGLHLVALALLACSVVSYGCTSNVHCSLNGVCVGGACKCDAAWEGSSCEHMAFGDKSGFRLYDRTGSPDNTSSWGGLPVRDEKGLWHLFAAEFVNHCGLGQWSPNSRVIRASSQKLSGPYTFVQEVLKPFHHNPTVMRAHDGTYLLFVIGRDVEPNFVSNCTQTHVADPAPGNRESNISLFHSKTLDAPSWSSAGVVLAGHDGLAWDADTTNPSAIDVNGSVYLMYRGCAEKCSRGEYIGLAVAPTWNCGEGAACSYERTTLRAPLWSSPTVEDPFIYRDARGGWHALLHNLGNNGGFGCDAVSGKGCDVGGHAFSQDGLAWTYSPHVAFNTTVQWEDGSVEVLNRRERPQFVFDTDGVTPLMLTNGAQAGNLPSSCSSGGTVLEKRCRSFTMGQLLRV